MTEILLRMLCGATLGLALVLLLRRPARRAFGAGPAFTLWLLPIALALAPLLPQELVPEAMVVLPGLTVTPHGGMIVSLPMVGFDWAGWLVTAWAVGAVAGLLRLGIHYFDLLRGLRKAPASWTSMLAEATSKLDVRRVRMHDAGPAVLWALPRALVLLPVDFASRFDDMAARGLVLRHELTHVRRGDALWSLAMEIATALLWFHPLAWLARARFRLDQELACDAASLRALPERTANYARALLDSVAVRSAPALIPWLAEPQLKERIAMLARIPPSALRRRVGFVAISALLAGALYVAGGQAPVRAATQPGATAKPPEVDVTFKNRNPPKYPAEAIEKGEQGDVMLRVTIDAGGHVTGVAVDPAMTTAATVLQTAAIQAAANWKFAPGMKDGRPVGGVVKIPVNFSLSGRNPNGSPACPSGFRYKQDAGKSYSCIAQSSAPKSS